MPVYCAKTNYDRNNIYYPKGSQVSLTVEEAQPDIDNGTLELVDPDPIEPPPKLKPDTGKQPGGEATK